MKTKDLNEREKGQFDAFKKKVEDGTLFSGKEKKVVMGL